MACMALKGHYNIALSTFTATKLNRPCLRGRTKRSTVLMSCGPQIWLDSAGRFVSIELIFIIKLHIVVILYFNINMHIQKM